MAMTGTWKYARWLKYSQRNGPPARYMNSPALTSIALGQVVHTTIGKDNFSDIIQLWEITLGILGKMQLVLARGR